MVTSQIIYHHHSQIWESFKGTPLCHHYSYQLIWFTFAMQVAYTILDMYFFYMYK